jgi:hypothetical protein
MVTLTDQMFIQLKFEASEYRRLLVVCRERVVEEIGRADRAERTMEALLATLRTLAEALNADLYPMAAQSSDAAVPELVHRQVYELIRRIQREAEYLPCSSGGR